MNKHIAIVGAGLVGSGWALVFARAGLAVKVFDASAAMRRRLPARLGEQLADLDAYGLLDDEPDAVRQRVEVCDSLEAAVAGARYVQESVLERADIKQSISAAIGATIGADTVVGSSTSGIPASAFTADVDQRERFLVAHPVNPPYLAPVVELVPAPWTAPAAVDAAARLMTEVGQSPVCVEREIEGFILNRLQGVLLREAWALYEDGYASLNDIDKTVRDGLGLRWAFMGPFETIDLNAPGGIRDYAERLGPLYRRIAASRSHEAPWGDGLTRRVEAERRRRLPADALEARTRWRDRRLMALAAHKAAVAADARQASAEPITSEYQDRT